MKLPSWRKTIGFVLFVSSFSILGWACWHSVPRGHVLITYLETSSSKYEGGIVRIPLGAFRSDGKFPSFNPIRWLTSRSISNTPVPKGYFPQWLCSAEWFSWTLLAWWKPGSGGNGEMYLISRDWDMQPYAETTDFRFRNCAIGKLRWTEVVGAVTHGVWKVFLRSASGDFQKEFTPLIDLWTRMGTGLFLHFSEFSDTDSDGLDELYFTVTPPLLWGPKLVSTRQAWALIRATFVDWLENPKFEILKIWTESTVRRMVVSEGRIFVFVEEWKWEGVKIFEYRSGYPAEFIERFSLKNHEMCPAAGLVNKGWIRWLVVGCDQWSAYSFDVSGKERFSSWPKFVISRKEYPNAPKAYDFSRAVFRFVVGKDFDGDGDDEIILWTNGWGVFLSKDISLPYGTFFLSNEENSGYTLVDASATVD